MQKEKFDFSSKVSFYFFVCWHIPGHAWCMILNTRAFSRDRKIAKSDYSLRHICPSALNNSASTIRIFMKFDIWGFLENLSRKFNFYWSPTRVTCILHKEHCTFIIICRWIFLEWEMFHTKVVEKIKRYILLSVTFLFENRAGYEIMRKNMVRDGEATRDNIMRRTRFACWITTATFTHS